MVVFMMHISLRTGWFFYSQMRRKLSLCTAKLCYVCSFLPFCEQNMSLSSAGLAQSACAFVSVYLFTHILPTFPPFISTRRASLSPDEHEASSSPLLSPPHFLTLCSPAPLFRHVSSCCWFISFPSAARASRRGLRIALHTVARHPANFFSSLQHLSVSLTRPALFARLSV